MKRLFYGWKVVAACFCIAVLAWTLGLFGASVYLQTITAAHGWAIAAVSSAITLFYLVAALLQPLVGRAFDRYGPRAPMTLGAVSMATGAALIGQVSAPWQLYPCFVLIGIGWATLSTTGISSTVAPWFERHQGRSITLAIMGASIAAIAGVPALLGLVSALGLRRGFAIAGAIAALVLLALIWGVLRHRGPAALGLARDGDAPALPGESVTAPMPLADTLARPRWLLWSAAAGFALGLNVQIGFVTHHVALATPVLGLVGAGLLVSGTGLAAFVGRLVLARIVDRMDVRLMAALAMLAQAASLCAIAAAPVIPVLVAASLVYGFCIGYVTTLAPVVVRREFGAAAFGRIYGSAAIAIQLTSALGPALLGVLRDRFGGYAPGLVIAAAVTVAGAIALLAGRRLAAGLSRPSGC